MSSPRGMVTRVMMISLKRLWSRVCASPAARVSSVLPVAGRTQHGDEIDFRIHQQVERKILLAVAGGDAPDIVALRAVIHGEFQYRRLAFELAHDRLDPVLAGVVDELIRLPLAHQRTAHPVVGAAVLLPGLHALAVFFPEILRQLLHAARQEVRILDGLVAE